VQVGGKTCEKIDVWQGNCMSYGGRYVLINSSLSNTPIHHMSMFMVPKNVLKMEKMRRKFFWQGGSLKRKYHIVKWSKVCKAKKKGGLGMKKLRKLNISLFCKWWWILENEQGLWQEIVSLKYIKNTPICLIKNKYSDSPVWIDLLKVRHIYLQGRKF
jgi:hypothetical protein